MPHDVFVLGLDEPNRRMLARLPEAGRYRFHSLLHYDELRGVGDFPLDDLLATCSQRLESFDGTVDAVVTLLDFPATELAPILAQRFGCPGPTLEAVLRCSHKYWSRLLQREVAPECIPGFAVFDPVSEDVAGSLDLRYPFWVKPLNAYRSHLGFRIDRPSDLESVLPLLREELPRLARPLQSLLDRAELPEDIAGLGAAVCIAEELIGGRQCTVEGYVHEGEARVYGVVDSIRDANRPTFARYQYPSQLPVEVQEQMSDVAVGVMGHLGYDDACFNVEFFWDRRRRRLWLLEINPRLSQSHCELFEMVDGVSHAQVMLDLALGQRPEPPSGKGPAAIAAKFFVRAFRDGIITRVPTEGDLARAEAVVPGAHVQVHVKEGQALGELQDQDSYSYELATIHLGAPSYRELLRRYRQVTAELGFEIST